MTLWGGRFEEPPDEAMWRFTVDHADRRLLGVDIEGSLAHVKMLGEVGILSSEQADRLVEGLVVVLEESENDGFMFSATDEDVHSAVERRLYELVGPLAGKLHTGRSRNDQIALDTRLYLKRAAFDRIAQIRSLVGVLVQAAEDVGSVVVPVYTHLQQAQAIPLAHHLLAYAWMLRRDADRFGGVMARLDVSPLGAGAAGGSSLPLDPRSVADSLGMAAVFENSIEAVGSRDIVAEYTFCAAQSMVTLSRLAEELVLWATSEFDWLTFSDRYSTGSSALPQKKNPDIAELVRGKSARVIGDVVSILTLQKGLPMAYNRDLQEDKAAVFHADDVLAGALEVLAGLLTSAEFHAPEPSSWVAALDLAEALVGRGVPFREAHQSVGELVARLVSEDRNLSDLSVDELTSSHGLFQPQDLDLLDPKGSVQRRRLDVQVADQIAHLRDWLN
ncbi:MAG: argininosuccinate lyase [Gammaproteobacteria bacterium]|nr:argininosuccinate lyase [Gammaproteobacteria bacterium]